MITIHDVQTSDDKTIFADDIVQESGRRYSSGKLFSGKWQTSSMYFQFFSENLLLKDDELGRRLTKDFVFYSLQYTKKV